MDRNDEEQQRNDKVDEILKSIDRIERRVKDAKLQKAFTYTEKLLLPFCIGLLAFVANQGGQ